VRVGIGYDSHRFDSETPLVLGGVRIPDHPGLAGHSDGDAVAHALIDALLGASGLGSIGEHFPDTEPEWRGADSMRLLEATVRQIEQRGYRVVNVDITVVAESPRIGPWRAAMTRCLADQVGTSESCVSVKGKSNETMGWIGRGEGLAVFAVALLDRVADSDTTPASIRKSG
jgi:2-C-methyl-D-erythritol 2,4-cyclodiphosphate synthase